MRAPLTRARKRSAKGYRKVRGRWKRLRRSFEDSAANDAPKFFPTPGREAMELLIIRHAIAFERDRHRWRDDGARPLSPAGIRRARKAAAGLKEFSKAPDRLLTSPLVRARQTARDSDGRCRLAAGRRSCPSSRRESAALAVLTLLGKDRSKRVAVVGHQPGLGALLTACLLGDGRRSHHRNEEKCGRLRVV